MRKRITEVTFHWSESIVITKVIDPKFKNREDAQYSVCLREAQKLLDSAVDELEKSERYSVETSLTIHLNNGQTKTFTFDLTGSNAKLNQWV